ncbi:MAG TPA: prephenate dehydratase [Acidimicrobiales bacterium]|nr:prephenate dehydratase [Acidimicrobiales bacterium]
MATVAYFGPAGTFTEEALLTQPDYAAAVVEPRGTITDVLDAVVRKEVDLGFVPMENAIEGTVNATLDALVFDYDLMIQREVVLDVHLHLLAPAGTRLQEIRRVLSFPVALAQCQKWLAEHLPGVEQQAANSTADAARQLGEHPEPGAAAIAPRTAARLYGLSVLVEDVEDHPENQTRFVAVAASGVPRPTGHDRTSIVCFQRDDRPGSLHGILGQFAARNINLTKLESRPTKRGLGDYCFVIDLDGHLDDEVVADCLRDLHASLAGVKFLGSYPAAGAHGPTRRREADDAWRAADAWLDDLRSQMES